MRGTRGATRSCGQRLLRPPPGLDLRFAETKSLTDAISGQNLITFTRASSGTYVGSDGLIKTATTNLLRRSEEFDNASWTKTNASITENAALAPNGTLTADKLQFDNGVAAQNCPIVQDALGLTPLIPYTISIYLKAGDVSEARLQINGRTSGGVTVGTVIYSFSLVGAGSFSFVGTSGTPPTGISASIVLVGDGWYRCRVTATTPATSEIVRMLVTGNAGTTGTGTNGFFMWGAQLEQSATVGEYIPTGATINSAPRFDHNPLTGESLGLLVEEARTNLLLNSATLSTQSVTVTAVAHTLSFYGTGTITLSGASTAGPVTGTGVFPARTTLTFTPTAGSLTLTVTGSVVNAQLEAGAFATSYIPTTTSAATRSADVVSITGTAFSSWYRQDEGTIFARCSGGSLSNNGVSFDANDGTTSNRHVCNWSTSRVTTSVSNVIQSDLNLTDPSAANEVTQIAFAFKANDFGASFKGEAAVVDTSGTVPTVDRLTIGDDANGGNILNGHIRRLTYWPQRLPNNSLVGITR